MRLDKLCSITTGDSAIAIVTTEKAKAFQENFLLISVMFSRHGMKCVLTRDTSVDMVFGAWS